MPWPRRFTPLTPLAGRALLCHAPDADGYFVRTIDGRPIGYRWLLDKPLKGTRLERAQRGRGLRRLTRIGQGGMEVLPMPPRDIAYWPDHRYLMED